MKKLHRERGYNYPHASPLPNAQALFKAPRLTPPDQNKGSLRSLCHGLALSETAGGSQAAGLGHCLCKSHFTPRILLVTV